MLSTVIVVDLLEDYFDKKLWPDSELPSRRQELVERTNTLAGLARGLEVEIVWVRQEFAEDLSDAFPHMKKEGRAYTIIGTPGCQLLAELKVAPDDRILVKKRFSAFHKTSLDSLLRHLGTTRVFLAGITTQWCVRSTATDAYQLGYEVLVVEDCCAGFSEEGHQSAINEMDGFIARAIRLVEFAHVVQADSGSC